MLATAVKCVSTSHFININKLLLWHNDWEGLILSNNFLHRHFPLYFFHIDFPILHNFSLNNVILNFFDFVDVLSHGLLKRNLMHHFLNVDVRHLSCLDHFNRHFNHFDSHFGHLDDFFNNLFLLNDLVFDNIDRLVNVLIVNFFFLNNDGHLNLLVLDLGVNSTLLSHVVVVEINYLISCDHVRGFNDSLDGVGLIFSHLVNLRHVLDSVDGVVNVLGVVADIRCLNNLVVVVGPLNCASFEAGVLTSDNALMFPLANFTFENGLLNDTFNFDFALTNDLVKLGHFDQAFHLVGNGVFNDLETRLLHNSVDVVRLRAFADLFVGNFNNVFNAVGSFLLNYLLNRHFDDAVNAVRDMHDVLNGLDSLDQFLNLNYPFDRCYTFGATTTFGATIALSCTVHLV